VMYKFFFLFTFSLLFNYSCSAQGIIKTYRQLSSIEKTWVCKHPVAALKIKKETKLTRKIVQELKQASVLDTISNGGQLDAFRHAFWMARITKRIGANKALKFGETHEKGNYEYFLKNIKEDNELQDSISCSMDLLNNKVGVEISKLKRSQTNEELKQIIIDKIRNGELFILKHNKENKPTDCENKVIVKQTNDLKKWNVNYCLVASNYFPK
jgi:hypothetical protein